MIVGIDEVGRGCLAGPLCVAAVAIENERISGLNDSKKLTKNQRQKLALEIRHHASSIGIGWVSAKRIDEIGLSAALRLASNSAFSQINAQYNSVIIDGTINFLSPKPAVVMKQADALVPAVSAASIIAKVARDSYMQQVHNLFDGYHFNANVGYGTKLHLEALAKIGPSPIHRYSFAPLATLNNKVPTITSGAKAEMAAAKFLALQGFKIQQTNWKTKWCEVDIIAQKDNQIYFVEVKYRRNDLAGRGLDYITKKKLNQMKFAAEMWIKKNHYAGAYSLAAVELEDKDFKISQFVINI